MHAGRIVAGKYRISRLVAKGSMGEIYEALHLGIGKRVALKLLSRAFVASSERIARFRREARAAGRLESDYIVQVFDGGLDDALGPYLVTELLVGEDLETRLARERRLDPATTAAIGYQVARGLAKAHEAGVVHRDLKPGNIFLAERDDGVRTAKILDFGISKPTLFDSCRSSDDDPAGPASDTDFVSLTAAGVTLGTPQYMSPEQAQGVPDLDGRSDVWSLAATLYEALCGHAPHAGAGSPVDVMLRIVRQDAPPLRSVAPWVPARLCAVLDAALRRNRDHRTPDAASFARALETAVPEARWTLSGAHAVAVVDDLAPPTLRSPPPCEAVCADARDVACAEEPVPSSAGGVEFFRRDGSGTASLGSRERAKAG